jgi:hypothetical protein
MSISDDSEDLGFTFLKNKNGEVWISNHGKHITTLRGLAAIDFVTETDQGSFAEQQQLMARETGNYKRGNERLASQHPRNLRGAHETRD